MMLKKIALAGLAASIAASLASTPAAAAPVVQNPNFTQQDAANNTTYGLGNFLILNWAPTGNASNSVNSPGEYNNGSAGAQTVVGYLSGPGASLSQVVSGFVVGFTYQLSLGVNARASQPAPVFGAAETDTTLGTTTTIVFPTTLSAVDPSGTKTTPFTTLLSNPFVATNSTLTLRLANESSGTSLLTAVAINQVAAVPEPISLAILGVGLAGVGFARRRRNAK